MDPLYHAELPGRKPRPSSGVQHGSPSAATPNRGGGDGTGGGRGILRFRAVLENLVERVLDERGGRRQAKLNSYSSGNGAAPTKPMTVFLTVDTEFWPRNPGFGSRGQAIRQDLARDFQRDIYGVTGRGDFGIRFQMDLLGSHGLRGVFFVESLFASILAPEPLQDIVTQVQAAGHEVQLHIHTEWLQLPMAAILPGRTGHHIREFTLDEQRLLISLGRDNLYQAGSKRICAFRAGNYGANRDTLRALASLGIPFDTSHNAAYLGTSCRIDTQEPLRQPTRIEGVLELPVTCFADMPWHVRPAQISACSAEEMRGALTKAWRAGWPYFVIVTHSNEILNRRGDGPNPVILDRYRDLCRFLGANADKFTTGTFGDLERAEAPLPTPPAPIHSSPLRTARRLGEQLVQRWLF